MADSKFARDAARTADAEREIQKRADAANRVHKQDKDARPAQTGARHYPEPPLPKQHQAKPGIEGRLDPAPMFEAPFYKGSEKLKDCVAVITGADSGIGRAVAVLFAREGADVAALYLDETEDAEETKNAVEAEGRRCLLLSGDVADRAFCEDAIRRVIAEFGRLDVLVNNAAFQMHVEKFEDLTEEHFDRTLKTNLYGYFHMAQAAVPHMKAGASIVNTGSVTGLARQQGTARLFDDQGRHPRLHAVAGDASSAARHPGERGRAGTGVDAAQSRRQGGERRHRSSAPTRR